MKKRHNIEKNLIWQKKEEKGFAKFKSIFDSMEAIVYVSDIQTHELLYANKKFIKTFYPDGTISNKGNKCWQVIQKGQTGPCSFCTNNRLILSDGSPGEPYEWEFLNTQNHRWYSIVDKAIEWDDNRIVRLETAFDITEKKENETLFRQFEKAIETSKKLESIGTLAGGIAHDFNNTMSTIIGNINLAQLHSSDKEVLKFLEKAENGIMQAKSISSKLIAFAKGGGPHKTIIDIENLIRKAFEKNVGQEKIEFCLEAEKIPAPFYADQDQIKTAIGNILVNAIESMKGQGRIDVAVQYQEQALKNARISISISDSGNGIAREHLDMIFDPYFTTKPLDRRRSKGLGLSIAWSIITKHGGDIHVESTLGQGSCVHIFLPIFNKTIQKDKPMEIIKHPTSQVSDITDSRVLVMDDDELTLDIISQLLLRLGYETIVASNGNQAIEIFETAMACNQKIDIVLLDYDIINGMGGIPTMEHLIKTDPHIRGILITGHENNTETKKYKKYGFSDMLEKPFSIQQLSRKIKEILM